MSLVGKGAEADESRPLKSVADQLMADISLECEVLLGLKWVRAILTYVHRAALNNVNPADQNPPPVDFTSRDLANPTEQLDKILQEAQTGTTFFRVLQDHHNLKSYLCTQAFMFLGMSLQGLDKKLESAYINFESPLRVVCEKLTDGSGKIPFDEMLESPIEPYKFGSPSSYVKVEQPTTKSRKPEFVFPWLYDLSKRNEQELYELIIERGRARHTLNYEIEDVRDALENLKRLIQNCYEEPGQGSHNLSSQLASIDRGVYKHTLVAPFFEPCFQTAFDKMQEARHTSEPEATRRIQMFFLTLTWAASTAVHEAYRVLDYLAVEIRKE